MYLVFTADPTNNPDTSGSDQDTERPAAITAALGTDSDVAASKTHTTDHSVIVSLTDDQQLQAFAFLRDHPFMWDKTDLLKYKKDKKRRQEYWQKLADLIGITCK